MGYTFYIGEPVLDSPSSEQIDRGLEPPQVRVRVTPLRDPNTEEGALLDQGYGPFLEWTRRVGLEDLFFQEGTGHRDPDGLMPTHPGAARLTPGHLERFLAAEARTAGCGADGVVARWFVRWTRDALSRCLVPCLYNR